MIWPHSPSSSSARRDGQQVGLVRKSGAGSDGGASGLRGLPGLRASASMQRPPPGWTSPHIPSSCSRAGAFLKYPHEYIMVVKCHLDHMLESVGAFS